MSTPRFHEWAWGYVTVRTVCGLTSAAALRNAVSDLGNVEAADRCQNCERMREAIGVSGHRAREGTATAADRPTQSSNGVEACASSAATGLPTVTAPASTPADPLLTEHERDVIAHAVGWESRHPLYRNHYCASEGHHSWDAIQALVTRGLMRKSREPSDLSGGDTVFSVTAIGIAALKQGSKRSRRGVPGERKPGGGSQ